MHILAVFILTPEHITKGVILTDNLFLVDLNMQLKVWEVAQPDNVQL